MKISNDQRKGIMSLAKLSVRSVLVGASIPRMHQLTELFAQKVGNFVTIESEGKLRSFACDPLPEEPLGIALIETARNAVLENSQTNQALNAEDFDNLRVIVSLMDQICPLNEPDQIQIGIHGVIVQHEGKISALLPEFVSDQETSPEELLACCCEKIKLPGNTWKNPETNVWVFTAENFVVDCAHSCTCCGS